MVHLSNETLSELLDGGPVAGAEEHLASCSACRGELELLGRLRTELRELPNLEPPEQLWSRIEARLPVSRARGAGLRWPALISLQVAAMAAVFVIGLGIGRVFQGNGAEADPRPAEITAVQASPGTLTDAMAEVRRLGVQYDAALRNLERLARDEGAVLPSVTEQRLATLDMLVEASRTALSVEPADPVLNSYLFAALEERDAVLREMNTPDSASAEQMWR